MWVGIVIGAGGILLATAVLSVPSAIRRASSLRGFAVEEISITPPRNELGESEQVRYYLCCIRDGTDQLSEHSALRMEDVPFQARADGTQVARVRYKRLLGFQFKCYLELRTRPRRTLAEVESLIADTDWERVAYDGRPVPGSDATRFWFLLAGYGTCETVDGYTNNLVGYVRRR